MNTATKINENMNRTKWGIDFPLVWTVPFQEVIDFKGIKSLILLMEHLVSEVQQEGIAFQAE